MGLYSKNRVNSLLETEAPEPFNEEDEVVDAEVQVDDTESDAPVDVEESFAHIMETCITLTENEGKMFDSLIRLDFTTAENLNEAALLEADGDTSATEEAKKTNDQVSEKTKESILDKLAKLWEAVKKAITNAFNAVLNKLIEITHTDKKLVDMYDKVLSDAKNYEGFEGLAGFAMPKASAEAFKVVEDQVNKIQYDMFVANQAVQDAANADAVAAAKAEYDKKLEEHAKILEQFPKVGFNEAPADGAKYVFKAEDVQLIKAEVVGAKGYIQTTKEALKRTQALIDKCAAKSKETLKAKKDDEFASLKAKEVFAICSETSKLLSKVISGWVNTLVKMFGACRKAYIILGRYAKNHANPEKVDATVEDKNGNTVGKAEATVAGESAMIAAISEANDQFITEAFGY